MGGDNIRTQMTAVFNFGRPFQNELKRMEKGWVTKFLGSLGGDTAVLESRIEDVRERGAYLTPSQTEGAVAEQSATRGGGPEEERRSERTGADVGLTEDEAALQQIDKDEGRLKWAEGARVWKINENHEWVQTIRELSLPIKAGPSGTTDRLMQMRAILGVRQPVDMRAACLAYLLPINAHSMVEIMEAASSYGLPFERGPAMYRSVQPFGSLEEHSPDPDFWNAVTQAGQQPGD